jgi:hypothetical protein
LPTPQDTDSYGQAPANHISDSTVDHSQSLRSNSYQSAQQTVEHTLLSNSTQSQGFIPASDSAPSFDPEGDLPVKPIKQEVTIPGKQTNILKKTCHLANGVNRVDNGVHDFAQHTFTGTGISTASQPPPFPIKGLKSEGEDGGERENLPWNVEISHPNQIYPGDTGELSMMPMQTCNAGCGSISDLQHLVQPECTCSISTLLLIATDQQGNCSNFWALCPYNPALHRYLQESGFELVSIVPPFTYTSYDLC